jgi:hypothetical protein
LFALLQATPSQLQAVAFFNRPLTLWQNFSVVTASMTSAHRAATVLAAPSLHVWLFLHFTESSSFPQIQPPPLLLMLEPALLAHLATRTHLEDVGSLLAVDASQ